MSIQGESMNSPGELKNQIKVVNNEIILTLKSVEKKQKASTYLKFSEPPLPHTHTHTHCCLGMTNAQRNARGGKEALLFVHFAQRLQPNAAHSSSSPASIRISQLMGKL